MSGRAQSIGMILSCLVLTGRGSAAQTPSSTTLPSVALPPINVLIPNYSGVPIGEVGGLEAGAFLARADDSSSVFYNPAGLTRAEKTSVSGTAGVFQFGGVSAEGLDESARTFQQVPAMFAFVLKDLAGRSNLAGGLSVDVPLSVTVQHGDADVTQVARDLLGLTKLNYNACQLGEGQPITVKYSDRVGEILLANPALPPTGWRHNFKYYA